MAINPESQYPGKINPSDASYPYGSARNITLPSDGTGTPWEAALVNDQFGFQQALLSSASVVPSGTPDNVIASQYVEALRKITGKLTDGKKYQFLAAAIENTGSGWAFVSDANHEKIGFNSIIINGNGEIELGHASNVTASAVLAISDNKDIRINTKDETTKTTLNLSAPLNFAVDAETGTITAESYWGSDITAAVIDNYCNITHPSTDFIPNINDIGSGVGRTKIKVKEYTDTTIKLAGMGDLCGTVNWNSSWIYTGKMKNIPTMVLSGNVLFITHTEIIENNDGFQITSFFNAYTAVVDQAITSNVEMRIIFLNNGSPVSTLSTYMKVMFNRFYDVEYDYISGITAINRGYAKINAGNLSSATEKIWVFGVMEIA